MDAVLILDSSHLQFKLFCSLTPCLPYNSSSKQYLGSIPCIIWS